VVPLVIEAPIWEQGVFLGSIISSEQTAAAEGKLGQVRRYVEGLMTWRN
jgi:phosphoenolpyruvate carboxykinase (GTP)